MALGLKPIEIVNSGNYPLLNSHPSWCRVLLDKIAEVQNGFAFKSSLFTKDIGIPLIRIRDVGSELTDEFYNGQYEQEYLVQKDDILIGMDGDFKCAPWNGPEGLLNQRVCRVVLRDSFFNRKLLIYLLQPYLDAINAETSSVTVKHLSSNTVKEIPLPLPPLPEQHRIVAKIEELFSELDKGVESLKTAQQQLKVYRQAVLKWAFEGRLTEEWRNQQKSVPTGWHLLEQIKAEREKQAKADGTKLKPVIPITETELSELPTLPKGWVWIRIGEIVYSVKDGPHYSPPYQDKGIPFISGGNIRPDGVDFRNVKYISSELNKELNKRCRPEVGDILYTKGGTTGIARVNTYNFEFNVWVHVAVLKIVNCLAPFYIQNALNSHHCYKQSQKYTHGVGNQDLGLTRMVNITLPICSMEEQSQIVQEIESRLSVADNLEKTIAQSLRKAEALRQSILRKAFEGKLVSQDPNDEPASKLLERIRAEKATQPPIPKTRKKATL